MNERPTWIVPVLGATSLAVAGVVILVLARWTPLPQARSPALDPPTLNARGLAPDFSLRSFAGPLIKLSSFRRKMIVLNFWASWCVPCREEMPNLEHAWQEFRPRGMVVLGINVADDHDDAGAFLKTLAITYPNVFDPEQTRLTRYQVTGLPTTFFVDPQMQIRDKVPGGYTGPDGYARLRQEILALMRL